MKKLFQLIYEKNSSIKFIICILSIFLLGIIYKLTNFNFILYCSIPFLFWLLTYFFISLIYVWVIKPIIWIIKKFKK
jgi:hypothetical protein